MRIKIAIQGQEASFHGLAARQLLGDDIQLLYCETFADTFASLANGDADKIVVAIENSLFGPIHETQDLLLKYNFIKVGELRLRIKQCLIGLSNAKLSDIREIYSQLPALVQCKIYLDEHVSKAKRIEQQDTAESVANIKAWDDPTKAAIASAEAAKLHGLKVLAAGIEDNKQNYTRFLLLEQQ